MTQAKTGDTVKVHYEGTFADGAVFDSSDGRDPLEFTIGAGNVIQGFENAVVGMSPGESVTTKIESEQAYGPHRKEMVIEVERDKMPKDLDLEVGGQLQLKAQNGQMLPVLITDVSPGKVTLDANHPLAGKDLTFKIDLVEIIP